MSVKNEWNAESATAYEFLKTVRSYAGHPSSATVQAPKPFGEYMAALEIGRHFTVKEVCEPNNASAAEDTGYTWLVPPPPRWPIVGVLLWVADEMRDLVDAPVSMRSLWRPFSYNVQVAKSSIESDHPNACGTDLDFKSAEDREKAMYWLCGFISANPQLEVSVGIGKKTLHVGVLSPQGRRHWTYDSFGDGKVPHQIAHSA